MPGARKSPCRSSAPVGTISPGSIAVMTPFSMISAPVVTVSGRIRRALARMVRVMVGLEVAGRRKVQARGGGSACNGQALPPALLRAAVAPAARINGYLDTKEVWRRCSGAEHIDPFGHDRRGGADAALGEVATDGRVDEIQLDGFGTIAARVLGETGGGIDEARGADGGKDPGVFDSSPDCLHMIGD